MTASPRFRPFLGPLAAIALGCRAEASGLDAASRGAVEATVDRYVAASNQGDTEELADPAGGHRRVASMVGRYRLPPTEEEAADSGQYVLCLKRQADGTWKLTADIWNGSGGSDERGADSGSPETAVS
jgi:hypothetical protein